MAWYKIEIHYGPGSQGTDITYRWWDYKDPPSDDEKREWCDDRVHDLYTDNATSRVNLVKELPEDVRKKKIEMYRDRAKGAVAMLKILKAGEL